MVKQYTSWMYVIVVSKCHVNLDLNIFVTKKKNIIFITELNIICDQFYVNYLKPVLLHYLLFLTQQ